MKKYVASFPNDETVVPVDAKSMEILCEISQYFTGLVASVNIDDTVRIPFPAHVSAASFSRLLCKIKGVWSDERDFKSFYEVIELTRFLGVTDPKTFDEVDVNYPMEVSSSDLPMILFIIRFTKSPKLYEKLVPYLFQIVEECTTATLDPEIIDDFIETIRDVCDSFVKKAGPTEDEIFDRSRTPRSMGVWQLTSAAVLIASFLSKKPKVGEKRKIGLMNALVAEFENQGFNKEDVFAILVRACHKAGSEKVALKLLDDCGVDVRLASLGVRTYGFVWSSPVRTLLSKEAVGFKVADRILDGSSDEIRLLAAIVGNNGRILDHVINSMMKPDDVFRNSGFKLLCVAADIFPWDNWYTPSFKFQPRLLPILYSEWISRGNPDPATVEQYMCDVGARGGDKVLAWLKGEVKSYCSSPDFTLHFVTDLVTNLNKNCLGSKTIKSEIFIVLLKVADGRLTFPKSKWGGMMTAATGEPPHYSDMNVQLVELLSNKKIFDPSEEVRYSPMSPNYYPMSPAYSPE